MKRTVYPEVIYRSEKEKYVAIADEIERLNRFDQILLDDGELIAGTFQQKTADELPPMLIPPPPIPPLHPN
jgi:hypothetical protein